MADKNLKPLLVVEDNPGLQKQLKWSFEGYDVHVASDRKTAISSAIRDEGMRREIMVVIPNSDDFIGN